MVNVQMRAKDRIDRPPRKSGIRQIFEKTPLSVVPSRDFSTLLVIAQARINQDVPTGRFDKKRMNAHPQTAILISEVRAEPRDLLNSFTICLRQDKTAAARRLQFNNFRDGHITYLPLHYLTFLFRITSS